MTIFGETLSQATDVNGVFTSPVVHNLSLSAQVGTGDGTNRVTYDAIAMTDADSVSPTVIYSPAYGTGGRAFNTVVFYTYGGG